MKTCKKDIIGSTIKVSVIVPVYNVEEYLEECLDSLLVQNLSEIEILLIDDGSVDSSGKICDTYAKKYSHIHVVHKENQGLGSARNTGFHQAKGKYVYFIDSDDVLDKDALLYLYEEAEKEQLDVVLFSAECFSDDSKINYNPSEYRRTAFLNEVRTGKDLFFKLVSVGEYYASIPLRFYNRTFLTKHNFCFPESIIHEDEAYGCLSLIAAEKAKCVEFPFYKRRFRNGSIMTSHQSYQSAVGYIHTWNMLMEAANNLDLSEEERQAYDAFVKYFLASVIESYYIDFNIQEKKDFNKVLKAIRNTSSYKELRIGRRLFLFSPFLYSIYRFIILFRKTTDLKGSIRQFYIWCEACIRLCFFRVFCKDKSYIILIGTPTHGNLGDQAIVYAEHLFFEKFKKKSNIVEITSQLYLKHKEQLLKMIAKDDLIIIDGGGSMGTLWIGNEYRFRDVIERFPQNRIFIFPQTAYYADDVNGMEELQKSVAIFSRHKQLTICCRDEQTYHLVQREFKENNSYYVPDMVLSLCGFVRNTESREGVYVCLREDQERITDKGGCVNLINMLRDMGMIVKKTSTLTGGYIDRFNRKKELYRKWREFSQAQLVITDRLHAMFFCVITGTPCIALDNKSHKVRGGYEWIKTLPYITFEKSVNISPQKIREFLKKEYDGEGIGFEAMFEELLRIVKGR